MEEDPGHVPVAPPPPRSSESRSKRMRTRIQVQRVIPGNRDHPSSAATPSATPSGAGSVSVDKVALEVLSEEEEEDEEENSFDHDDELSVSLPSADGVTITQEGDGDEVSKAEKGKRGAKRSKAGVQLSPSKSKASRVKRADCWKYFKLISVASKKEFGVQITKAKCKFCSKSYVYHQGGATSELLIYLDEPNVSVEEKNFNLLNYWKVNTHRFPVVASMAKMFLAVPASSVSSESTFSTGGRILDDYRSSLKPSTVQALVCASSWIRGSQSSIILGEGDDGDIESVEFPKCVVASN